MWSIFEQRKNCSFDYFYFGFYHLKSYRSDFGSHQLKPVSRQILSRILFGIFTWSYNGGFNGRPQTLLKHDERHPSTFLLFDNRSCHPYLMSLCIRHQIPLWNLRPRLRWLHREHHRVLGNFALHLLWSQASTNYETSWQENLLTGWHLGILQNRNSQRNHEMLRMVGLRGYDPFSWVHQCWWPSCSSGNHEFSGTYVYDCFRHAVSCGQSCWPRAWEGQNWDG